MLFSLIVVGTCLYLYSLRGLDVQLSGWIRTSLVGFRLAFLLALLWLMTLPQTRETSTLEIPPALYVVLDDSSSMQVALGSGDDPTRSRWDAAREALEAETALPALNAQGFPLYVTTLSSVGDTWSASIPASASPVFPETNLAGALGPWNSAKPPADASYLVLVTDGQYNQGGAPQSAWDEIATTLDDTETRRIYTLGIGPVMAPYDLAIDQITFAEAPQPGQPAEATIQVLAQGQQTQAMVPLSVLVRTEDGAQLTQQETFIEITPDEPVVTANITLEAIPTGMYVIEASIPAQPDELTTDNNQFSRGFRIDETLDPVLVLTGGPNWDFKFLKRILEDDPNLEIEAYLVHELGLSPLGDRGWIENRSEATNTSATSLETLSQLVERNSQWSAIVLHNMRFTTDDLPFVQWLNDYISNGGGILTLPGSNSAMQIPTLLAEAMPAPLRTASVYQSAPIEIQPDSVQLPSLATTLQESETLPPLQGIYRPIQAAMTSRALVTAQVFGENPMPLVRETRIGLGTVLDVHTDQLWRLQMIMNDAPLRRIWLTLLYQCNNRLQPRQGEITTDAYFYDALSTVSLQYQVSDTVSVASGYVPMLTVEGPAGDERIWLTPQPQSDTRFETSYTPIQPGRYHFSEPISGASTSIRVGASSAESRDLRQNVTALRTLAETSGGRYANLPGWNELLNQIPFQSRVIEEERLLFIGERWWVSSLLILFLALEWFVRWRKGLP